MVGQNKQVRDNRPDQHSLARFSKSNKRLYIQHVYIAAKMLFCVADKIYLLAELIYYY